jgi:hypothetical protein
VERALPDKNMLEARMTADEVLTQAEEALKRGDASGADAALNRMWPNDDGNTPHDALHMRATVRFAQERFSDGRDFAFESYSRGT